MNKKISSNGIDLKYKKDYYYSIISKAFSKFTIAVLISAQI
ncbi:hypothetical protein [Flexilinea flocculi]|nr:hypothetical protein [Flexilinea flocculi]